MLGVMLSTAACLGADPAPAQFAITVPPAMDRIQVQARYSVTEPYLDMFEGWYSDDVPGGLAGFVENLRVTRPDSSAVSVTGPNDGRWNIEAKPGESIAVHYDVRLDHEDRKWPFGVDEIAYTRPGSTFFVSRTVLVVNESVRNARVDFSVPQGWRVATPWRPVDGDPHSFNVANKRLLLDACVLVGDFTEREVRAGDTVVRLAIGHALDPYADALERAMKASVLAYTEQFGGTPQARFLAVLNDNPAGGITDGSAYPNSVSMLTPKRMEGANFVQAVYTLSHEVLHLWNGFRLRPAEQMEWFREGFTDYITWRTLIDVDLVEEGPLLVELRRQLVAYLNLNRSISLAAAGADKARNATLIYEGGSLTALCLDSRIRNASGGERTLLDFMREVYARTAMKDQPYDAQTLVSVASELAGKDMQPFFDRYVNGAEILPLQESFAGLGLRLTTKTSGSRVSVTLTPDDSANGIAAAARDAFLGRN